MTLTTKEQAVLAFLPAFLKAQDKRWFDVKDLKKGLKINRHEAAGIISALGAKGLAFPGDDNDPTATPWFLTDLGKSTANSL